MDGNGTFTSKGLYTYTGEWKTGLKHGKGEIKYEDGTRIVGSWEKDRLDGEGTFYEKGGNPIEAVWYKDVMVPLGT
jgi:1-phosphatidylinositol-4-phosphate 5-kinase